RRTGARSSKPSGSCSCMAPSQSMICWYQGAIHQARRRVETASASGRQALHEAGEGDGLPHVVQSAHPGDGSLEAEAEARVGDAAPAAQVEVPLEGLARQVVGLEALQQGVEVALALAAADDLAVALGGQDVHAEGEALVL